MTSSQIGLVLERVYTILDKLYNKIVYEFSIKVIANVKALHSLWNPLSMPIITDPGARSPDPLHGCPLWTATWKGYRDRKLSTSGGAGDNDHTCRSWHWGSYKLCSVHARCILQEAVFQFMLSHVGGRRCFDKTLIYGERSARCTESCALCNVMLFCQRHCRPGSQTTGECSGNLSSFEYMNSKKGFETFAEAFGLNSLTCLRIAHTCLVEAWPITGPADIETTKSRFAAVPLSRAFLPLKVNVKRPVILWDELQAKLKKISRHCKTSVATT